jgi:hypothetical protein
VALAQKAGLQRSQTRWVHVVNRDYGVRRKWWWRWWWDTRTRKLGGGRGLPHKTENRVHTLARQSKVLGRRPNERVHAHVDIVVEVVGSYVRTNNLQ